MKKYVLKRILMACVILLVSNQSIFCTFIDECLEAARHPRLLKALCPRRLSGLQKRFQVRSGSVLKPRIAEIEGHTDQVMIITRQARTYQLAGRATIDRNGHRALLRHLLKIQAVVPDGFLIA